MQPLEKAQQAPPPPRSVCNLRCDTPNKALAPNPWIRFGRLLIWCDIKSAAVRRVRSKRWPASEVVHSESGVIRSATGDDVI